MSHHWSRKYLEIPWKEKGRDFDGADCWGQLRLVYRQELLIELPDYTEEYVSNFDYPSVAEAFTRLLLRDWIAVTDPLPMHGVLLWDRDPALPTHCGVVVEPGSLMTVSRERGAVVAEHETNTVLGRFYRQRIVGFYRHREDTRHERPSGSG